MARLMGESFHGATGGDNLEAAAGEGEGLLEAAAGCEEQVGIVGVIDDEDRGGPVGVGLLARVVVEGTNVSREIAGAIEANLMQEVVDPALATTWAERIAGEVVRDAGDGLVACVNRVICVRPVNFEIEQ